MRKFEIFNGDCAAVLKTLPSGSVNSCITSPPYFGLRDYGCAEQIGQEETPEEYCEKLVEVFREVKRVLRDDGTLWINIGDSYATNKGAQPPTNTRNSCGHTASRVPPGYKAKDLIGIPWLVAFALRADGWYLRQDIIWHKPNAMPESVNDRLTKCYEHVFLLAKSPRYFFDAAAIAEPIAESTRKRLGQDIEHQAGSDRVPGKTNGNMKACPPKFGGSKYANGEEENRTKSGNAYTCAGGMKNKRDVWTISTAPFKGAHFATFPKKLVEPMVLAGCPRGGIVLDPFTGSGTTGIVAIQNGRRFCGIELNSEYCTMATKRIEEETAQETLMSLLAEC